MQSKVRKPTRAVEADTLREKECGEMPRFVREAFLLWGRGFLERRLRLKILWTVGGVLAACAALQPCAFGASQTQQTHPAVCQAHDADKATNKPGTKIV